MILVITIRKEVATIQAAQTAVQIVTAKVKEVAPDAVARANVSQTIETPE